ncbi:MAG: hypothetical protein WBX25_24995 [Rhodomicrobium sp.]
MLPTYQIRKLPGGTRLWEVIFNFKNGNVEQWVGFNGEVEASNWANKKFLQIASKQKQNAAA